MRIMKLIALLATVCILCISVLCFSTSVFAGPDLTVTDFTLRSDKILPGDTYDFVFDVKNIGDEPAKTRLPNYMYFGIENVPVSPGSFLTTLAETRNSPTASGSVIIISNGEEKEVFPAFDTFTYLAQPETPEQIQERKDNFLERAEGMGYDEEQTQAGLDEIEKIFSNPHDVEIAGHFVTINPGETLRYESDKANQFFEGLSFPVGKLSIDPIPITLNIEIDPLQEADTNTANNKFTKTFTMDPNVIQGPAPQTAKNKKLADNTEYFAYAAGCAIIQGKEICLSSDDKEELLYITIDGDENVYSFYSLFMAWVNEWFSDGKLAPTETINGVKITLYKEGFKLKFIE